MKTIMLAALPALLTLAACGEPAAPEASNVETAVANDDNDAPAPVAEPVAKDAPHDESVPHDH